MSSDLDTEFRLEKRVTLCAASVYLGSYTGTTDLGNFAKAKEFLEKYNIGLEVWPGAGHKQDTNTFHNPKYDNAIPNEKEAYKQLRKDIDDFLRNRCPKFPFVVPIIFCHFLASGVGITPHSTKTGITAPACLIRSGISSITDKMTIVHEMGHAALYPKHEHNATVGNLMHEADGRKTMYRYQAEAFAKSMFSRAG
jgi:hypothetical protein